MIDVNLKLSSQNVHLSCSDKFSNSWYQYKRDLKDYCKTYIEDYDSGNVTISVNDYLSMQNYEDEFASMYNINFSKDNKIDRFESNNIVVEQEYSLEELNKKLHKEGFLLPNNSYKRSLTSNQEKNILKMIKFSSAANFSVPGAGKTTDALAFYAFQKDTNSKLVVIAPKNAFDSWDRELDICFDGKHDSFFRLVTPSKYVKDILKGTNRNLLINYEKVRNIREELDEYISRNKDSNIIMILDESHRIKHGTKGKTGRAILALNHHPKNKVILSGTPCPNKTIDLISQFQFLFPNKIFTESSIKDDIEPHYCRTSKKDLDLPKPKRFEIEVDMNEAQVELYNLAYHQIGLDKKNFSLNDKLKILEMRKKIMWLIQILSNPKLLLRHEHLGNIPKGILDGAESPKIDFACNEAIKLASENKKCLIWTNFTQNVDTLQNRLIDLNPTFIDGRVKVAEDEDQKKTDIMTREYRINKFLNSDDCFVMIANPAAASESISLHMKCRHAIYVDKTYNAGQYLQSRDRIHRLGLKKSDKVSFIEPYHPGTFDERIKDALNDKIDIMEEILNDNSIQVPPEGFNSYHDDINTGNEPFLDIEDEQLLDIVNEIEPI